jgi:hypothetical protein
MKVVRFLGDSLKVFREFPKDARQDTARQLEMVQKGRNPDNFKSMSEIGKGVQDSRRIRDIPGDLYGAICRRGLCPSCFSKEDTRDLQAGYRYRKVAVQSTDAR